jgi:hypothetical protein
MIKSIEEAIRRVEQQMVGRFFVTHYDDYPLALVQVVEIVRPVEKPKGQSCSYYEVRDHIKGYSFECSEEFLVRELNEMETIAWHAR